MKMNKTVAAVAAGMIAFGAMFSASAAGIGYVNSNALLQAHPKMQMAQLDMRTAAQKAEGNGPEGKSCHAAYPFRHYESHPAGSSGKGTGHHP